MFRRSVLLVIVAALLLATPLTLAAEPEPQEHPAQAMVRLPGHVLPALAKAKLVPVDERTKAVEANQPLLLTIVLKREKQADFDHYLRDVYDPHSLVFHHFLTPQGISDRFGPSPTAYDAVFNFLQRRGFKMVESSSNRLTLAVLGTRAQAEDTFKVHIKDFELGGARFFANDADPTAPSFVAARIATVIGLSNLAVPKPAVWSLDVIELYAMAVDEIVALETLANQYRAAGAAAGASIVLLPADLALKLATAWIRLRLAQILGAIRPSFVGPAAVITSPGAGQKIGLVAFSSFRLSDVSDWLALAGLSASLIGQVSQVDVAGGAPLGSAQSEVLLAVDTILSMVPGAKVVVYDTPLANPGASFQALFNRMINDHVNIIANTFNYCEDQTTAADVNSLDAVLATAAASGISVLNATGDAGSVCSDGSANTVAVPADSPHATAVGGTSVKLGPGFSYQGESWYDGSTKTPPTGQSGFGVSRFFNRPAYQNTLNTSLKRSVPDVVDFADQNLGATICEADAGGCPTGLAYGGTSLATATWAASAAILNQRLGHPAGFLNTLLYPLAGTGSFHNGASMGSDFAHVGLGSVNLDQLTLKILGRSPGPVSSSISTVIASSGTSFPLFLGSVPADGQSTATIAVTLGDVDGNTIGGKTIMLSASSGSHAVITPPSGVASAAQGLVTFAVRDSAVENVTFSATDMTDGVKLTQTATVNFTGPAAASGGISANPASVTADGVSASTVTVTLKDAKGNPAPNKEVILSQAGGHSTVSGLSSGLTDSSGMIQFAATDLITETVTYSAVDATDGFLTVPGTASVSFIKGTPPVCNIGPLKPVPGSNFTYTNYVTGFPPTSENCLNPAGMAFDSLGNLYVSDYAGVSTAAGGVYKFGPGGGTAGIEHRLNAVGYPPSTCANGLAFSKDGKHLYLARQACSNTNAGDVVEISQTDASVIRVLTHQYCASGLATDPVSGDLFFSVPCNLPAPNNNIYRISNPNSASPTTSIYAAPGGSNGLIFGPDGTLYTESFRFDLNTRFAVAIEGTNTANPGAFTYLAQAFDQASTILPSFNASNPSQPTFLLSANGGVSTTVSGDISLIDLTQNPPTQGDIFNNGPALQYMIGGPDGCAYATEPDRIIKICKSDGSGPFAPSSPQPALILNPSTMTPNPKQGTPVDFTTTFQNLNVPAGTPVTLTVIGPNLHTLLERTDANGQANFNYTGAFTGTDVVVATASAVSQTLASNPAHVTWTAGPHTTFATLNLSAKSAMAGKLSTLTASLFDVSVNPTVPIPSVSLRLTLEGRSCTGLTDAKGNASCAITPVVGGSTTLTVNFAGNSNFLPANASVGFSVIGPTATPTPTPTPQFISTPTPTPTATHTPTPTPTPPACVGSTPAPTVPVPTPTPPPGNPVIAGVSSPVLVGASFTITGKNFTAGSEVNFFVATSAGPLNAGPLKQGAGSTSTELIVPVPASVPEGEGFASVEVVNTDEKGFPFSNLGYALLQGSAAAGLPSITGLNGHGLAATSIDPGFATANIETTLTQGSAVTINGNGFDTTNGVAVDVFTGGGKTTTFIKSGDPNLKSNSIIFDLSAAAPTGPGSIRVSNAGKAGTYTAKSEAVSVPIGARIIVTGVTQSGSILTVNGAGFSTLTVINFFNARAGGTVNLGGFGADGLARIPITLVNSTRFTFTKPAGAVTGLAFVQALNPPFVPFTSSGTDPCGAFALK